jgi:hypothetical protein
MGVTIAGMLPEMGFLLPAEGAVLVTEYLPIFNCLNPEIVTECAFLDYLLRHRSAASWLAWGDQDKYPHKPTL